MCISENTGVSETQKKEIQNKFKEFHCKKKIHSQISADLFFSEKMKIDFSISFPFSYFLVSRESYPSIFKEMMREREEDTRFNELYSYHCDFPQWTHLV